MKKNQLASLRTWIEIDSKAARKNYDIFKKIIGPKVKLWAVVKSNAYGHGLFLFSRLLEKFGVDGFCVDSAVEGFALRRSGIKKDILVLGPTLPHLFEDAAKYKLTITIPNFKSLKSLAAVKHIPEFHIKMDTGMHRQGFYPEEIPKVIQSLNSKSSILHSRFKGLYTHFASAKDVNYPTFTELQFQKFNKAMLLFEKAGFHNLVKHCSATGGTLMSPKYHLGAVRIGIGLYGFWPSKELETTFGAKIKLRPILSWRAIVSDVKKIKAGDYIGYDLTERASTDGKMAVLPIGYWHGLPRALSGVGEVILNGKKAKILGRISMDLIAIDASRMPCKPGDVATILGGRGEVHISAPDAAQKSGTTHYELLTRLNPLMERMLV